MLLLEIAKRCLDVLQFFAYRIKKRRVNSYRRTITAKFQTHASLFSLSDATPEPPNDELILFGAGDGVTDTHFDGSASQFPSPELENVLEVTNTHIKYFNPNM